MQGDGKPKTCADPLQRGPLSKTRVQRRHRPAVGRLLTLSLIVITMKPGDHIKPLRSCNELSRGSRPCTFTALSSAAVNTRARTRSPNGLSSMFRQLEKKQKRLRGYKQRLNKTVNSSPPLCQSTLWLGDLLWVFFCLHRLACRSRLLLFFCCENKDESLSLETLISNREHLSRWFRCRWLAKTNINKLNSCEHMNMLKGPILWKIHFTNVL